MKLTDRFSAAGRVVAAHFPDALMISGAGAIARGAWLVYEPAGYVVAGLFALAAGLLLARKGDQ